MESRTPKSSNKHLTSEIPQNRLKNSNKYSEAEVIQRSKKSDKQSKPGRALRSSSKADKKSKPDVTRDTELTDREVMLVQSIWAKTIDHQQEALGMVIFRKLFLKYPEYEYFFLNKRYSVADQCDIFTSPHFRDHVTKSVVPKIKDIVFTLDNPEELRKSLTDLGHFHARLRIGCADMENMKNILLEILAKFIGKNVQKDGVEVFQKSFSRAFVIICDAIKDYQTLHPEALESESTKTLHLRKLKLIYE